MINYTPRILIAIYIAILIFCIAVHAGVIGIILHVLEGLKL